MSQIQVDNIYNKEGTGSPSFPLGANVTGVVTATSFSGSGANLTGIDATALKDSNGTVRVQANTTGAVITGNVSVGGTLTYEDVTNVDAVGLITARSGIKVTSGDIDVTSGNIKVGTATTIDNSGVNVTGVVTATSFEGSGASLTGIDAAPTVQLVADGAVAANTAVIVGTNGKAKTIVGFTDGFGSEIDVASNTTTNMSFSSIAEDASTNRVVYLYRNAAVSPNATYYRVGTRSGSSITWGTAAALCDDAVDGNQTQIIAIGTDKFFAIYVDKYAGTTNFYTRVITTTSSNTATLGTKIVMTDSSNNNITDVRYPQLQYNSVTGNIIACYGQNGGSGGGVVARIYSVSGTTITRGAPHQVNGNTPEILDSCWMQYKKSMAIVFRYSNNQMNSAIIKEPDSGTTLVSLVINIMTQTGGNYQIAFDSKNEVLVSIIQRSSNNEWQYIPGKWEANGSTGGIDWYSSTRNFYAGGSAINSSTYWYGQFIYQPDVDKFLLVLMDSSSDGWATTFASNPDSANTGTKNQEMTATPNSSTEFSTNFVQSKYEMKVAKDGAVLIPFVVEGGSDQRIIVKQYASTTLTTGNFVGFSDGTSYSDGQTVTIKVVGNTTTQSSLTPGSLYYVSATGSLSTTADTPNVVAGRALSATSLLIQPA